MFEAALSKKFVAIAFDQWNGFCLQPEQFSPKMESQIPIKHYPRVKNTPFLLENFKINYHAHHRIKRIS